MSGAIAYLGTLAFGAFVLWLHREKALAERVNELADTVDALCADLASLKDHTHAGLLTPDQKNLLDNLAIEAGLRTKRAK